MAPNHGKRRFGRVPDEAREIDGAALVDEQLLASGNLGNRLCNIHIHIFTFTGEGYK